MYHCWEVQECGGAKREVLMNCSSGKLVIISGPSGAGKSTIVRRLLTECGLPLVLSISATTRTIRKGEREGVDYYFLQPEDFEQKRRSGEFLECAQVFGKGHWYGTPREPVSTKLAEGKWVILEIDVQGALEVMRQFPGATSIFIHTDGIDELRRRLEERGTETQEAIQNRLEVAQREVQLAERYTYQVINHTVDQAVQEICELLTTKEKSEA